MFRLPRSLLLLSLATILPMQASSQWQVQFYYPNSAALSQVNLVDTISATWAASGLTNTHLVVWGPNYTSQATFYAWFIVPVNQISSYNFSLADSPNFPNYSANNGTFPFRIHLELVNGTDFTVGNNSDSVTVKSSPASPTTYALSYTVAPTSIASSTTASSSTSTLSSVSADSPTATPSQTSPAGSSSSSSPSSSGISGGAIAGIVIGALAGLAILVALVVFLFLRRRRTNKRVIHEKDGTPIEYAGAPGDDPANKGPYGNGPVHELPGEGKPAELAAPNVTHEMPAGKSPVG